jgi:hypothetical protein
MDFERLHPRVSGQQGRRMRKDEKIAKSASEL